MVKYMKLESIDILKGIARNLISNIMLYIALQVIHYVLEVYFIFQIDSKIVIELQHIVGIWKSIQ